MDALAVSGVNATNPNCRGCSNMDDLFELHSFTFLLVPLQHAAHAQGLGTESDICSHTSGSLAAPVVLSAALLPLLRSCE